MENLPMVMSTEMRDKLHAKYNAVNERLANLKKVQRASVKTNGQFKYTPEGTRVASNIPQETDISKLVQIYSFLRTKQESYDAAAKELGLDKVGYPPFRWLGYPCKDWLDDIKIRISLVSYKEEHDRLTKIKEELSQYFLPEDKLKQLFDTLEDIDVEIDTKE